MTRIFAACFYSTTTLLGRAYPIVWISAESLRQLRHLSAAKLAKLWLQPLRQLRKQLPQQLEPWTVEALEHLGTSSSTCAAPSRTGSSKREPRGGLSENSGICSAVPKLVKQPTSKVLANCRITQITCPWSSLIEGDEGSYLPNCNSNLVITLHELSLLFCNFINTSAYRLGRYEPSCTISCCAPQPIYHLYSEVLAPLKVWTHRPIWLVKPNWGL